MENPLSTFGPTPARASSDNSNNSSNGRLLDVLPLVFAARPETAKPCLFIGNSGVYRAACTSVYRELDVEVAIAGTSGQKSLESAYASAGCCRGGDMQSKLLAILRYPVNAAHVRVIRFRHPCPTHTSPNVSEVTRSSDRVEAWEFASDLISALPGLEELVWETGFGVGDSMWKSISALRNLKKLSICNPPAHPAHVHAAPTFPRITIDPQLAVPPGFDLLAPVEEGSATHQPRAIGLGGQALGVAWEDLEELRLESLSGPGARSLGTHLQILSQMDFAIQPKLHSLTLSTHFLDTRLCESIGAFGSLRSLRHITLGTSGLKFTAECLRAIVEECSILESLRLVDVEGRLGKSPWSNIIHWPSNFKSLEIDISETGSHHSWVLDHLASIHEVPFDQLVKFSVRRIVHSVAQLPFPPPSVAVPQRLASHQPQPIPSELLEAITTSGGKIEQLCLDWWEVTTPQLELLVVSCPRLRKLQVTIKGTVVDILGLSNAFGQASDLTELSVTSSSQYNSVAPKGKTKKRKESKEAVDLPPFLADRLADAESDPSLLDLRDLRKFLRRMPNFRVLRWIGRDGKGEWRVVPSKKSSLVSIDFTHSVILTKDVWLHCQMRPPSFVFEDDIVSTKALELPPSPDRSSPTELPALSRTTTGSSTSLMTASTPPSSSPTMVRRSSGAGSLNHSTVLGIEWEALPSPTSPVSQWPRKASLPGQPRRLSSTEDTRLEIKTNYDGRRNSRSNNRVGTTLTGRTSGNGTPRASTSVPPSPVTPRLVPGSASPKKASTPLAPLKQPARVKSEGWIIVGDGIKVKK